MTVEFPEKYILVFTIGYQAMHYRQFNDQMQQFHGAKARFDLGRESFALYPPTNDLELKASVGRRDPGGFEPAAKHHTASFLRSLRRDRSEPVATIEMGQRTNVLCCMAVASLRSGRRVRWNGENPKGWKASPVSDTVADTLARDRLSWRHSLRKELTNASQRRLRSRQRPYPPPGI